MEWRPLFGPCLTLAQKAFAWFSIVGAALTVFSSYRLKSNLSNHLEWLPDYWIGISKPILKWLYSWFVTETDVSLGWREDLLLYTALAFTIFALSNAVSARQQFGQTLNKEASSPKPVTRWRTILACVLCCALTPMTILGALAYLNSGNSYWSTLDIHTVAGDIIYGQVFMVAGPTIFMLAALLFKSNVAQTLFFGSIFSAIYYITFVGPLIDNVGGWMLPGVVCIGAFTIGSIVSLAIADARILNVRWGIVFGIFLGLVVLNKILLLFSQA